MENQLNLNKAVELYGIIGQYVPMNWREFGEDYLAFIGKIIDNIKNSGNHKAYFDAIQIMTDVTYNTLSSSDSTDVLELFMRALIEWRILDLIEFFRELGYDDRKLEGAK